MKSFIYLIRPFISQASMLLLSILAQAYLSTLVDVAFFFCAALSFSNVLSKSSSSWSYRLTCGCLASCTRAWISFSTCLDLPAYQGQPCVFSGYTVCRPQNERKCWVSEDSLDSCLGYLLRIFCKLHALVSHNWLLQVALINDRSLAFYVWIEMQANEKETRGSGIFWEGGVQRKRKRGSERA